MPSKNLSEELFKPRFKHPETSSLIRRIQTQPPQTLSSALEGQSHSAWYRMINRMLWSWRGLPAIELGEVLARIAASNAERTRSSQLDTVIGYRGGNWIYEWSKQAARWQQQASDASSDEAAGRCWLHAANLYGVAGYPHLKGDELAEQAQVLASRAYEEATSRLTGELKELDFPVADGGTLTGFLHMPPGARAPYPTVLLCGSLDALQTDHYRLFHDYFAPRGIAMLTIDMPSVGFSSKWKLTQETSFLHQQVLRHLENIPWVDHTRVAAFGLRFGGNVAVRLAFLESQRLRAVACLGPVVHSLLSEKQLQESVPPVYMDVLASRLGMRNASDAALRVELGSYSLRTQGLLGRRTSVPLLSAFWPEDIFSPEEESRLIVRSSADGKLLPIARTRAMHHFDKALRDIVEWLAKRLNC